MSTGGLGVPPMVRPRYRFGSAWHVQRRLGGTMMWSRATLCVALGVIGFAIGCSSSSKTSSNNESTPSCADACNNIQKVCPQAVLQLPERMRAVRRVDASAARPRRATATIPMRAPEAPRGAVAAPEAPRGAVAAPEAPRGAAAAPEAPRGAAAAPEALPTASSPPMQTTLATRTKAFPISTRVRETPSPTRASAARARLSATKLTIAALSRQSDEPHAPFGRFRAWSLEPVTTTES